MNTTKSVLFLFIALSSSVSWGGAKYQFPYCDKEVQTALKNFPMLASAEWSQVAGGKEKGSDVLGLKSQLFRSNPSHPIKQTVRVHDTVISIKTKDFKTAQAKELKISKTRCAVSESEPEKLRKPSNEDRVFDDESIYKILQSGITTIVYTWSPYMPLSFTGIPNIQNAAKFVGAKVIYVVDPTSDPADVQKVLKSIKSKPEWAIPWESDELRVRGFGLHYPTSVLLHKGKISRAYSGHKSVEGFVKWAKNQIEVIEK